MHLLIDGYNLLYALENQGHFRGKVALEEKRKSLIELLRDYHTEKFVEVTVVFDSSEPQFLFSQRSKIGGVEIIFSDETETADIFISKLCKKTPRGYVVISNDHEVQHYATTFGCEALSVDVFIPKLMAVSLSYVNGEGKPGAPDELEEDTPLYPRVNTKKKGVSKRAPKSERRKKNILKNL